MTVTVIRDKCIGCGLCTGIAPDVFKMEDDGFAHANANGDKKYPKEAKEAADACPVKAIEIK